jgi:hypothetical protein
MVLGADGQGPAGALAQVQWGRSRVGLGWIAIQAMKDQKFGEVLDWLKRPIKI